MSLLRGKVTKELPLGVEEAPGAEEITPWATYLLIAVNVLVYIVTSYPTGLFETLDRWAAVLGFTPADLLSNPYRGIARILTAMFTHANIIHIFFNMYFLYLFGRAVEKSLGHIRYLLLYVISGIAAALTHSVYVLALAPSGIAIPSVGASGAISGVLGAYMILYPGTRLAACFFLGFIPFCFELAAAYYLLFWFAMQVYMGYLLSINSEVAFFAHAGGFIAGMALLPLLADYQRISILRIRASARRLWGWIIFYPLYVRRELSPTVKLALSMLTALLAIGSLYTVYIAPSMKGLIASYDFNAKLSDTFTATIGGSFYIKIDASTSRGVLLVDPLRYSPAALATLKLLAEENLLYNPNLASRTVTLAPGTTMLNLGSPLRKALLVRGKLFEGVYNSEGMLVKGHLKGDLFELVIARHYMASIDAKMHLSGVGNMSTILFYSLLVIVIILLALYTVLAKDKDLVITPE